MRQYIQPKTSPFENYKRTDPRVLSLLVSVLHAPFPKTFLYIDKILSGLLFFHLEWSQLSQHFFIGEMLQFLRHFSGLLLDCLQYIYLFVVLRSQEAVSVPQVWCH